jgi:hypothetical protein
MHHTLAIRKDRKTLRNRAPRERRSADDSHGMQGTQCGVPDAVPD